MQKYFNKDDYPSPAYRSEDTIIFYVKLKN